MKLKSGLPFSLFKTPKMALFEIVSQKLNDFEHCFLMLQKILRFHDYLTKNEQNNIVCNLNICFLL